MILPSRKLLLLLLPPVPLLLFFPTGAGVTAAAAYDLALLLLAAVDLLISPRAREIEVVRRLSPRLSLRGRSSLAFEVRNRGSWPLRIDVTDDAPEGIERPAGPVRVRLEPLSAAEVEYALRPLRRGRFEFGDIHIRRPSSLGLLVLQGRIRARASVKVYPDAARLARYDEARRRLWSAEPGTRAHRRRGGGRSFESLRDYVPGDDLGDMAWKATARRGRPIVRNYETERSQNVLLVLDCGRLMTPRVEDLSLLDHAVNAAVLFTYVAVKRGDSIGLLAFSDRIEGYVPPTRGRAALKRMEEALYLLEPRLREPNYDRACRFLSLSFRKRALVVIITDAVDRSASSMLLAHAARFARTHLTLCITLRNLELEGIARGLPGAVEDLYPKAVAIEMLERRCEALAAMRRSGVDVLDVDPRKLSPALVDRYLFLKDRMKI